MTCPSSATGSVVRSRPHSHRSSSRLWSSPSFVASRWLCGGRAQRLDETSSAYRVGATTSVRRSRPGANRSRRRLLPGGRGKPERRRREGCRRRPRERDARLPRRRPGLRESARHRSRRAGGRVARPIRRRYRGEPRSAIQSAVDDGSRASAASSRRSPQVRCCSHLRQWAHSSPLHVRRAREAGRRGRAGGCFQGSGLLRTSSESALDRDAHGGRRDPDGGAQEDEVTDRQHCLAEPGGSELRAHAREEERRPQRGRRRGRSWRPAGCPAAPAPRAPRRLVEPVGFGPGGQPVLRHGEGRQRRALGLERLRREPRVERRA